MAIEDSSEPLANPMPLATSLNDLAWERLHQATDTRRSFVNSRKLWLGRVLGVDAFDRGPVTRSELDQLHTGHLVEIVEGLGGIWQAAEVDAPPDEHPELRIGLYLGYVVDAEIGKYFNRSSTRVQKERKFFADSIAGAATRSNRPVGVQEAINDARRRVVASILGPAAMRAAARRKETTGKVGNLELFEDENFPIFTAAEVLAKVEAKFVDYRIIGVSHKGLLRLHFLDTKREMTVAERNAIGEALRNLRTILKTEMLRSAGVPKSRELSESLAFLQLLVDSGSKVPPSRATIIKNTQKKMHSDGGKVTPETITADDQRLDRALSWLFRTKETTIEQPPVEPKRRHKKVASVPDEA